MTPQAATAVQPIKTSAVTTQTESQELFNRIEKLYSTIAQRAFEIFDSNGRRIGNDVSDWLKAESEILHPVHLEIAETDQALTVTAEVPGFAAKELDVQVEGSRLTISGNQETKEESTKGKTIYSERCSKQIFRSMTLPSDVDASNVSAVLKDGVLSIALPKTAQAKSVRIEPKPAD